MEPDFDYENDRKQLAWEAYLKGYDLGKNIESLSRHRVKTANANFERWWDRNGA